jgi:hypothetical protein
MASNKRLWSFLAFPPVTSIFQLFALRRSKSLPRLHRSLIWENFIPVQCLRGIDLPMEDPPPFPFSGDFLALLSTFGLFPDFSDGFVVDFWPLSGLFSGDFLAFSSDFSGQLRLHLNLDSNFKLKISESFTLNLRGDVRIYYIILFYVYCLSY